MVAGPERNLFFPASCAIILITFGLYYPTAGFWPEPWAEQALNFFETALSKPFWIALSEPDYGYLPLVPRLISLALVQGLHCTTNFPKVSQYVVLLLVSVSLAYVNLHRFRSVISSDKWRFLLSLAWAALIDREALTYVNFSYILVFFLICNLWDLHEDRSWPAAICTGLAGALIFMSKALIIAFLPWTGMSFLVALRRSRPKYMMITFIFMTGGMIQLLFAALHRQGHDLRADENTLHIVRDALKMFFDIAHTALGHVIPGDYWPTLVFYSLPVLLIGGTFFKLRTKPDQLLAAFGILATALCQCLIIAATRIPDQQNFSWLAISQFKVEKLSLVAYGSFFYMALLPSGAVAKLILLILSTANAFIPFIGPSRDYYSSQELQHSDWGIYRRLIEVDAFCIPVNPYPTWWYHHCRALGRATKVLVPDRDGITFSIPDAPPVLGVWLRSNASITAVEGQFAQTPAPPRVAATKLVSQRAIGQYFIFDQPKSFHSLIIQGSGLQLIEEITILVRD